ncbi:hypothetical protein [Dehalococcoides sp. UCH007]|uniref:hypothetical protein n=1 Tax=Dehalococcoides sp. UCH007 TaxID=1522671 RepID=UPI0012E035FE|nr:hypothetical protein [Dehalococcoides sp. UCH007]
MNLLQMKYSKIGYNQDNKSVDITIFKNTKIRLELDDIMITPQAIQPDGISSTLEFGMPKILSRHNVHVLMFEIAKKHRNNALGVKDKSFNLEIKDSMIAILFCFTCLEAYINLLGNDFNLDTNWDKKSYTSIEKKLLEVSKAITSVKKIKTEIEEDSELFNSFKKLKYIREKYIVHKKPKYREVIKSSYGNTDEIITVINAQNADWACHLVQRIVLSLDCCIEKREYIDWVNSDNDS